MKKKKEKCTMARGGVLWPRQPGPWPTLEGQMPLLASTSL